MIQDIGPDRLDNSFKRATPEAGDPVFCFREGGLAARYDPETRSLSFPLRGEFPEEGSFVHLFSLAGRNWFLAEEGTPLPTGWELKPMAEIRQAKVESHREIFAVYTAWHLHHWMENSRFCGACGSRTVFAEDERAKVCPACGGRIYPRINPAVIVGVRNGERILLTRYRGGFRFNALIAGFTEIGETLEETVQREVMEEAGIRVKNIRYYKSQPWGIADDILAGFYCDVDGDDTIRRDEKELQSAVWTARREVELQPIDYSLTNEMMRLFRDGMDPRD